MRGEEPYEDLVVLEAKVAEERNGSSDGRQHDFPLVARINRFPLARGNLLVSPAHHELRGYLKTRPLTALHPEDAPIGHDASHSARRRSKRFREVRNSNPLINKVLKIHSPSVRPARKTLDSARDDYALGVDTTAPDPLIGRLVDGRYEVLSRVARGGMATVYLANDRRLTRRVALKVITPHRADGSSDLQTTARFRDEARASAQLTHPGIVAVHDQGEDGALSYLTMEYVPGTNLRRKMSDAGALAVEESLELLEQILAALGAAHAAGLVHRDVKPENVLIDRNGRVKVTDFGLAHAANAQRSTASGILGTVAYMAPELIESSPVDARADVYSVGVLAFEMLTGRRPFDSASDVEIAAHHVNDQIPAPSQVFTAFPPVLDELVTQLAARRPEDRPVDATVALARVRATRTLLSATERALRADMPGTHHTTDSPAASPMTSTALLPVKPASIPVAHSGQNASTTLTTRLDPVEASPSKHRAATKRFVWLLIALLALAGSGLAWWLTTGPGALKAVPDGLVGVSIDAASDAVRNAGLEPMEVEAYDDNIAAGNVISTDPDGGTRVDSGSSVTLTVSLGVEMIEVPTGLVGSSEDDATRVLTDAEFSVADAAHEHSDTAAGTVLAVSVDEGSTQPKGLAVQLTVSDGPDEVQVPRVVGDSVEDATAELEAAGFVVNVNEVLGALIGIVVGQDPSGGSTIERGATVTLNVA